MSTLYQIGAFKDRNPFHWFLSGFKGNSEDTCNLALHKNQITPTWSDMCCYNNTYIHLYLFVRSAY